MAKTKMGVKYNDSCIKMFTLLKMLAKDEATYKKVIALFADEENDRGNNPNVTLNKYLNTLKIFGIKVKKSNNKFHLLSSPNQIEFEKDDLIAIKMLKLAASKIPSEKALSEFNQFINSLEIKYGEKTKKLAKSIEGYPVLHLQNIEKDEFIRLLESHIENRYRITLTYTDKDRAVQKILCDPVEVKYYNGGVYFCVLTQSGSRFLEIPAKDIKQIVQQPGCKHINPKSATVSYNLKGRLAKNYTLRDWEYSPGLNKEGALVVINSNEDFDILAKRLMKYGSSCTVISPKTLQDKVNKLIGETLKNYV